MHVPADVYTPSDQPYRGLGELDYPLHAWATVVTHCGKICFRGRKVNLFMRVKSKCAHQLRPPLGRP